MGSPSLGWEGPQMHERGGVGLVGGESIPMCICGIRWPDLHTPALSHHDNVELYVTPSYLI